MEGIADTELIRIIIENNYNMTIVAGKLEVNRTGLYRNLKKLRDKGLLNDEYRLIVSKKLINKYLDIASGLIGTDRVDNKDSHIIVYNQVEEDREYTKEQLRLDRGYYKQSMWLNDIDIIIDLSKHYITEEEFTELIFANEQWVSYKLGRLDDNPFDYVDMQDIYNGTWKRKIELIKELSALKKA